MSEKNSRTMKIAQEVIERLEANGQTEEADGARLLRAHLNEYGFDWGWNGERENILNQLRLGFCRGYIPGDVSPMYQKRVDGMELLKKELMKGHPMTPPDELTRRAEQ